MRVILKWSALAAVAILAGLQVVPPPVRPLAQQNAPHGTSLQELGGHEVGPILDRACRDCHSNETTVPWYGHIAPVSWVIAKHVRDGQKKLNFSDWDSQRHSSNEIEEICDAVSNGSMPLRSYALIHRDAKLSKHDVDSICNWADSSLKNYSSQQASPPWNKKHM